MEAAAREQDILQFGVSLTACGRKHMMATDGRLPVQTHGLLELSGHKAHLSSGWRLQLLGVTCPMVLPGFLKVMKLPKPLTQLLLGGGECGASGW